MRRVYPNPRALRFRAKGIPKPKGSHSAIIRWRGGKPIAVVIPAGNHRRWEKAVKLAASRAINAQEGAISASLPFDCPVAVRFLFKMPKPKTARFDYPAVKPDYDKLARSTTDALEGVALVNDSRIVSAEITLEYCAGKEPPGCFIEVEEVI
jgi:Holliday junction resolvase RusA-like endonuclease